MEGFGQSNNGGGCGLAIVGSKRNIALTIVEQRLARNISREALFLLALHRLGGPAQGIAREARLALIDLRPRLRQGRVDAGVDIGLYRSTGDLRFIDFDSPLHLLFHAVEIERFVAGDVLGHFLDEALGYVPFARQLLGIGFHQQIENGGRQYVLGEIIRVGEGAAGIATHRSEPGQMRGLCGA